MKPLIRPRLINGSFGDPMIYCPLTYLGKAFAFDMGSNFSLANRELQRLETVYLSHTHMDHIFGFDNFLRANLKTKGTIRLYGPKLIHKQIQGKLQGFTWNLTHGYGLTFEVCEIRKNKLTTYRYKSREQFRMQKFSERQLANQDTFAIHKTKHYSVRSAILDHRVPSQAYRVDEHVGVSINKQALIDAGWVPGPWLQQLKEQAVLATPTSKTLKVLQQKGGEATIALNRLIETLILPSGPYSIAYVSDTVLNDKNHQRIVKLAQDVDLFYCESTFCHADIDKAKDTYHLTAKQAGELAKEAGAKRLQIFHFSKKYLGSPQMLIDEASEAFGKAVEAKPYYLSHHQNNQFEVQEGTL